MKPMESEPGTERRAAAAPRARRAALAALVLVLGCSRDEAPKPPGPATVRIEVAAVESLADRREYVGNVRSIDRIEIRARVRGYLLEQHFEDGARVARGARLFRIDPRPFEVAVAEARGELARTAAEAERARKDIERAEALFASGVVSPGLIDERRAARDAAVAAEAAARARLKAAELDLSYTDVRAPIAGRMGRALVDLGNLVGESGQDTVLAELVVEDPVRVYFAAPEGEAIPHLDAAAAAGSPGERITVQIVRADGTRHPQEGFVDYVDPSVDAVRGTLSLRAVVPNPDGALRPGQFVRVTAKFPEADRAIVVPQRAVLDEQGGSYVLVVTGDDHVERRPVRPGRMVDGRQEILSGLEGGERVIVDGLQTLRPGDAVRPEAVAQEGAAEPKSAGGAPAAPSG